MERDLEIFTNREIAVLIATMVLALMLGAVALGIAAELTAPSKQVSHTTIIRDLDCIYIRTAAICRPKAR